MRLDNSTLKAFAFSLALHTVVVAAFAFSLSLPHKLQTAPPQDTDQPIQAFAVDTAAVQEEIDRQQAKEASARAAEEQRQKQLAEQERAARVAREQEEQKRQEAIRQREETQRQQKAEAARLEQLKQEQAREAERLEKLKAERAAADAKRKAEEQARLERERKRAAEEKRKAEEQARLERERKAREEAERKRKAEEAARRKAEEEARQAQIAAEELNQRIRAAVPGWQNVVKAHVHKFWALPPGSYAGRESLVEIRLALNGNVLSVRTVRSSGDASFDRLAEATIQKASPLPMPGDAEVAKAFAQQGVQFIFRPSQ